MPATAASEPAPEGAPELAPAPARSAVPEDLRVPWDWLDLALFLLFAVGALAVVAQGLQFAFASYWGVAPEQILATPTLNTAFAVTHQMVWSLLIVGFLWVILEVRTHEPFWRAIGFRIFRSGELTPLATNLACVMGGMLLAILVNLLSALFHTPEKLRIEEFFQTRESVLMMMAAGILVAPLVEEVVFRGFFYPVLARRMGIRAGVLVTGSLFGLMHAGQLWGGWGQIVLLVVVGIVFTYARARSGSVLASYLLHLGYNAFLLLGFYFATSGLKNLPAPK